MPLVLVFDLVRGSVRRKQYSREPRWVAKYRVRGGLEELRVNLDAVARAHPEEEDAAEFVKELARDFVECSRGHDPYADPPHALLECLNRLASMLMGDGLPYHVHRYVLRMRMEEEGRYVIDTWGSYVDGSDHRSDLEIEYAAYPRR